MTGHVPVMTAEALEFLQASRGGLFVDCTVGLGGHSRLMLEAGASRVIGLDRDLDALAIARETLAPWPERVELVHADYRTLGAVLDELGIPLVDGALADLGVPSLQSDAPGRGPSFQRDEPLACAWTAAPATPPPTRRALQRGRARRRDLPAARTVRAHHALDRGRPPRRADRDDRAARGDRAPLGAPRLRAHRSCDADLRRFESG